MRAAISNREARDAETWESYRYFPAGATERVSDWRRRYFDTHENRALYEARAILGRVEQPCACCCSYETAAVMTPATRWPAVEALSAVIPVLEQMEQEAGHVL